MIIRALFALALGATFASCTAASEDPFVATSEASLGCESQGCGANAATVGDGIVFDRVDSSGQNANRGGLTMTGARLTVEGEDFPAKVRVVGHDLFASVIDDPEGTNRPLAGLTLTFTHVKGAEYEVNLPSPLQYAAFWTAVSNEVPVYPFHVRKTKANLDGPPMEQPTGYAPLCTGPYLKNGADVEGAPHYTALVFQGDDIDSDLKTVKETSPADPWFNLACIGTSMAKLHLLRHSKAGSWIEGATIRSTSEGERQSMLKMLTADYCGDGRSFTTNGVPLAYEDAQGWYTRYRVPLQPTKVEAIWDARGAICLNRPRAVARGAVLAHCPGKGLRECGAEQIEYWKKFGSVISGTRPLKEGASP